MMNSTMETQVDDLLCRMTLAEKIGQMTQAEKNSITPEEVAEYTIGSVLSGGGGNPTPNTAEAWAQMVGAFQEGARRSRLAIPLLYGVDAVHGHNNVYGATIFPHNIGLGASRDADLVERVARATACELAATQINWDFAPSVSVPQDIRWGRSKEGFSEEAALVSQLGAAYVRGLQQAERPVLGCAKHFLGDGGTAWGTTRRYSWIPGWWQSEDAQRWQIDQGDTVGEEAALLAIHLPPYIAAIEAGVGSIMVSYSSWNGTKMHKHRRLVTDCLKGELGFEGFVVSDWLGVSQLHADFSEAVVEAINAGLDMVMVPMAWRSFIDIMHRAVAAGRVAMARIDDAVRRILRVKFQMGLFVPQPAAMIDTTSIGSTDHRELAREAVRKSLVLLKTDRPDRPVLAEDERLLVAGRAADDIGLQCGGWTIDWQGRAGEITIGTTLLAALRDRIADPTRLTFHADGHFDVDHHAEVGLVVLNEPPYAEGEGDRADLSLTEAELQLVGRVRRHCERLIVVLYSGRPLLIDGLLAQADAIVAAWLPGTEAQGVAELLLGDHPFTGTLPFRWPRSMAQVGSHNDEPPLFPLGYGLR